MLNQTVRLAILEKYPLQQKYLIRFLRYIIDRLESQHIEIHDDLYSVFCSYQNDHLMASNLTEFSFKHYRIHCDGLDETITLKENHNKISEGTTGLNVWEAALVLCEWSMLHRSSIDGKHVIELGSGTGLSGLVIGKCCRPQSITLTDGNDKVLDYLRTNVSINFSKTTSTSSASGSTTHETWTKDNTIVGN